MGFACKGNLQRLIKRTRRLLSGDILFVSLMLGEDDLTHILYFEKTLAKTSKVIKNADSNRKLLRKLFSRQGTKIVTDKNVIVLTSSLRNRIYRQIIGLHLNRLWT
ncbi:MAG: hypothetical protein QY310_15380 [Candidatus Jettenia sp. CY-1]|nr:MAG: hypothetical protein QY310_15380 [Candidatus Jettenia sp. CY-1]